MNTFDFSKMLGVSQETVSLVEQSEKKLAKVFEELEQISQYNQARVLRAFSDCRISDTHFNFSTGYGYDDHGRDTLDRLYAEIFECEDALVRHTIISGTHALTTAFFGVLRPGDTLISVTGRPYDTLEEVIGIRGENSGSLKEFGVSYGEIPLKDGAPDLKAIQEGVPATTKAVLIQRSKGYESRV